MVGAHGHDHVREGEPRLEKVDAAVPLGMLECIHLGGDTAFVQHRRRKMALIAGVVHRQHRGRAGEALAQFGIRPHVEQGQRGMPIVRMHQDRSADEARNGVEHRAREQGKAACVVGVVPTVLPVQPAARKRRRDIDEDDLGTLRRPYLAEEAHLFATVTEIHTDGATERCEIGRTVAHGPVEREKYHDVGAALHLHPCQPRDRFGQPPGAGKGTVLRCDVHNGRRAMPGSADQRRTKARD